MRADVGPLLRDSLFAPRLAAERLLALRLPRAIALELAALVAVLGALLVGLASGGGATLPMGEETLTVSPFMYGTALALSLIVSAGALFLAGRLLGGQGTYDEALVVVAWVEFVALTVRLAQIVSLLILPFLAPVIGLAGLVLLLWCLVNFVRVLHRFDGFGRPVLTLLIGGIGLAVVATLALSLLGGFPVA